ncbi:hypothetical protein KM043_012140 [Ampulex compressa]|nr:hypothetical protein KM043_012140 [Ampulex compressa]
MRLKTRDDGAGLPTRIIANGKREPIESAELADFPAPLAGMALRGRLKVLGEGIHACRQIDLNDPHPTRLKSAGFLVQSMLAAYRALADRHTFQTKAESSRTAGEVSAMRAPPSRVAGSHGRWRTVPANSAAIKAEGDPSVDLRRTGGYSEHLWLYHYREVGPGALPRTAGSA